MVHLQEYGYPIEVVSLSNQELTDLKAEKDIPAVLISCHTAEVGGYLIEGHVPADVIEQLLQEQPDLRGLALPGMPAGSPGMGGEAEGPLEIMAFDEKGEIWLYASR